MRRTFLSGFVRTKARFQWVRNSRQCLGTAGLLSSGLTQRVLKSLEASLCVPQIIRVGAIDTMHHVVAKRPNPIDTVNFILVEYLKGIHDAHDQNSSDFVFGKEVTRNGPLLYGVLERDPVHQESSQSLC
jgi:hypothetical protein